MSTVVDKAQVNRLARTIFKNRSAAARSEALLEIRKFDDPRVTQLLETVSQKDRDAGVRDLAHNLLRKRQIQTELNGGSPGPASDHTTPPATRPTTGWTCRYCGAENATSVTRCASCGAEKPPTKAAATQAPANLRIDELFLLHEGNRKFITGQRQALSTMFGNAGFGCMFLFLIPFVLAGLVVVAFTLSEWHRYTVLNTSGVTTWGEYTGRRIDDDDDSTTYYVSYEFTHNDRLYRAEHSIDYDRYRRSEPGGPVEILYAPDDPTISRVAGTNDAGTPVFLTVFSIFWNLVSWGMFLGLVYSALRNRQLVREGTLVPGEILAASGKNDSDGDFQVSIQYGFAPPNGSHDFVTKTERAQRNDLKRGALPARGTPVAVLYRNVDHYRMM